MARRGDRPFTDNETIEYCITLMALVMLVAIVANALTGCSCSLAY